MSKSIVRYLVTLVLLGIPTLVSAQAVWVSNYSAPYESVAFTPDGKYVLGGSGSHPHYNSEIHMFEVGTGNIIRSFVGHQGPIIWEGHRGEIELAISSDGKLLASRSFFDLNTIIRLWDIETGTQLPRITLEDPAFQIYDLEFTPDGTGIIYAGNNSHFNNGVVRLIDVNTGETIWEVEEDEEANAIDISPDGLTLAVGLSNPGRLSDEPTLIYLLDLFTGQEIKRFENNDFRFDQTVYDVTFGDASFLVGVREGSPEPLNYTLDEPRTSITSVPAIQGRCSGVA